MNENRKGIALAGNILADVVKLVDTYPKKGMLATVTDISVAVGGCVPNTAIDIAKIDPTFPLTAIGKVGNDENGRFVVGKMKEHGINCDAVLVTDEKPTSTSDVISSSDGERTFFHMRGANALFCPEDINLSSLDCRILHIGYIFLLDLFDKEDAEFGTAMARFLCEAQKLGIKTSIDVVSESSGQFKAKLIPALKYCDYAILNEIESSLVSDLEPYNENGSINLKNIENTMQIMANYGVKEKIIVHCKKASFSWNVKTKTFTVVPSLNVPREEIKGSVGAGDAFCAASLYGIYNGYTDKKILEFASCAAACNLFSENSVDGMREKAEIDKMEAKYGWEEL